MIALAALALAACLPIDSAAERITAHDLAVVLAEWSRVDGDTSIGLTPAPGVIRVLRAPELRRMAVRQGIESDPSSDVCFERPVAVVTPESMLAAMQTALPHASIRILESSRTPAPAGQLQFPLSALRTGYWFGHVSYGAGRRFVVWARVDVKIPVKRVIAATDLVPGQPIAESAVRLEAVDETLSGRMLPVAADALEDVIGRVPKRRIPAGGTVLKVWLDAPKVVQRGDAVKVEVVSGSARLEAEGIAETAGAAGEIISVQNPASKRRFRARIEAAGRVSVKGGL